MEDMMPVTRFIVNYPKWTATIMWYYYYLFAHNINLYLLARYAILQMLHNGTDYKIERRSAIAITGHTNTIHTKH